MGHSQPFFFIFVFSIIQFVDKILPMSGFEPRISGVGSNRSTNWATTTAQSYKYSLINHFPSQHKSLTCLSVNYVSSNEGKWQIRLSTMTKRNTSFLWCGGSRWLNPSKQFSDWHHFGKSMLKTLMLIPSKFSSEGYKFVIWASCESRIWYAPTIFFCTSHECSFVCFVNYNKIEVKRGLQYCTHG